MIKNKSYASAAEAAAVNPKGTKMLLANGVSTFFISGKPTDINGLRKLRNSSSRLIISLVVLFQKIALFSKDLPNTATLRPKDLLNTSQKNVVKSSYGPKGRICSGTSLGRTQDVSLTIIHRMSFQRCFQLYIRYCTAKISEKRDTPHFAIIMVRDVSTKVGPVQDVLRTLCASWVIAFITYFITILFLNSLTMLF